MKRVGVALSVTTAVCLTACGGGGSAAPQAGGGTTTTRSEASAAPTSSASSSSKVQNNKVGVDAYVGVALTAAELPTGYVPQQLTAHQDLEALNTTLKNETVTPSPGCETLGPLTAESADTGMLAAFSNPTSQEVIAEFLAPAGTPSLADIASAAAGCKSYTVSDHANGVQKTGSITVIDTPKVTADKTLGLSTTTMTTTPGRPSVTTVQTDYLAETKGTLVTINTKGGPSGAPVPAPTVADVFAKAVQKVDAGR